MSKDQPKSDDSKRKWNFRKITSILNDVIQFYYVSIPLLIALIVLGTIESFKQIPGLESPLFDPGLTIGLYFIIMSSVVGLALLYNSKREMKILQNDVKQIKNDLYEQKKIDSFKKIEKKSKKKSFSLIDKWKNWFGNPVEDIQNWRKSREIFTKDRTFVYIAVIGLSLFFINIAGQNLAENIAPTAKSFEYNSVNDPNFDLEYFEINYTAYNLNNNRFDLMQQTEQLQIDVTIKSNYENNSTLKFQGRLFLGGQYLNTDLLKDQLITANQYHNFSRVYYLDNIGVNRIFMDFKFHEFHDYSKSGGVPRGSTLIEEETISAGKRVFSQSEYESRTTQYFVYYYLAVISSPLVLIGVRSLKEIIEDKNK